jgi:hypothetical protein
VIQPGTVMYMKTTEEPVLVLEGQPEVEGNIYILRPTQTQDGIKHLTETIARYALETEEENTARKVARSKLMNKLMFGDEPSHDQLEMAFPPHKN